MAKYQMDTLSGGVYMDKSLETVKGFRRVIVLPEADWRRVAELAAAMGGDDSCCCPCDRPCGSCQEYKDVVALIAKVEAENA